MSDDRECSFCMQPIRTGHFCGPACHASWSLLFEDPEAVVPDDDVYADDDGALTLPLTP